MKTIKYIILSTICIFATETLFSQDLLSDLQNVQKTYQTDNLYLEFIIKEFFGDQKQAINTTTTVLSKQKNNYFIESEDEITLVNNDYQISVNHEINKITCSKSNSNREEKKIIKKLIPDYREILKQFDDYKFIGSKNSLNHYQLKSKEGHITVIDLYINTQSKICQKVKYTYNEEYYGESFIIFEIESFKKPKKGFNKEIFSEKKFLSKDNQSISLQPEYKTYELLILD